MQLAQRATFGYNHCKCPASPDVRRDGSVSTMLLADWKMRGERAMVHLVARHAIWVILLAIAGGCHGSLDSMTLDDAVRVRQDGLRRIRSFFDNNPSEATRIGICLLRTDGVGHRRFWQVTDNSLDDVLAKELITALRDHSEPITETLPCYQCHFCPPFGTVVVAGRNSALVITIGESGAHVGDITGLFVNRPFFRALERFVVEEAIINMDQYYWLHLSSFRKASGELSLNAPADHDVMNSTEALEKAIKKWPPGSFDDPTGASDNP